MDLYSALLTAAAVSAGVGCVFAILTRLDLQRARLVQWPSLLGGLGLALVVAAGTLHLFTGHGPRSPEPMEPIGFVSAHPELVVIAVIALLALGVARSDRR